MVISGHNSSTGVRNYLKITKEKKRNILNSVMQRLTKTTTNKNVLEDREVFTFLLFEILHINAFNLNYSPMIVLARLHNY